MDVKRFKMETLKRSVDVLESLELKENQMIVLEYFCDVSISHYDVLNNKNIGHILNGIITKIRTNYHEGQVNNIIYYSELDLNLDPIFRMFSIRFVIIGNGIMEGKESFNDKLKTLVDKDVGGFIRLLHNPNPEITDVLTQILPVTTESLGKSFDEVFDFNLFPKFYSNELFEFIYSPIKVLDKSFIYSDKKITLRYKPGD